ncbi:MAG: diguanylate cyclase [Xanthomonadales bacterium]|nr:diguanylate cyclase [Xanthomonadales bacterium]
MNRQHAVLVVLLLLAFLGAGRAQAQAAGWTIEFHAAADLDCTSLDAAQQRAVWDAREADASGLAASRSLWMRLMPHAPGAPAVVVARKQIRSEWYDYRDPTRPRRSNVRIDPDGSAPGLQGLLLPEAGEWWAIGRPLYLCLHERLLTAKALHPSAITVLPAEQFRAAQHRSLASLAIAIGTMLAMAALALAFRVGLRERMFLDYSIYVVGFAAYALQITDVLAWLLPMDWREGPAPRLLANLAMLLMLHFGLRFTLSYTDVATAWPRLARRSLQLAWIASAAMLVSALAFLLGDGWSAIRRLADVGFNALVGLIIVMCTFAVISQALQGRREARIYLLGWLAPMVLLLASILRFLGITPDSLRPSPVFLAYAAALESLVLGWGIAERAHQYRRSRDEALHVAEHDALTGVLNRDALSPRLSSAMAHPGPSTLLYLDVDHFKSINDQHGHGVGDQVLRRLAERCRGELRGVDTLARLGGEEFVALLSGLRADEAQVVAERIRLAIEGDPAAVVPVTISIGVAVREAGESIDAWMQRADQALYAAKHAGRNRVVLAS